MFILESIINKIGNLKKLTMYRRKNRNPNSSERNLGGQIEMTESRTQVEKRSSKKKYIFAALFILLFYYSIPLVVLIFPQIVEQVVFLNMLCLPLKYERLNEPLLGHNLSRCGNFFVKNGEERYGVWHILPNNVEDLYFNQETTTEENAINNLKTADNIVLYLHGNGFHRGIRHRIALYKLLQKQKENYHIISFDYRGFGDSTGWPSEAGLIDDALFIMKWLKSHSKPTAKFILWGHSLGSSISTMAAAKENELCESDSQNSKTCFTPDYLILEGPFTNLRKGAYESFLAKFVYPKSLLKYALDKSFTTLKLSLETDKYIKSVPQPVLLLHAEDDDIINVKHSVDLLNICRHYKHSNPFVFARFGLNYGCSHNHLTKSPDLQVVIKNFLNAEYNKNHLCEMIKLP